VKDLAEILQEHSQWAKSPKNSLKECVFVNSALKCCQKYTPTNCFFGDFARWDCSSCCTHWKRPVVFECTNSITKKLLHMKQAMLLQRSELLNERFTVLCLLDHVMLRL